MTPLVLAIATFVSTLLGGLVALHRRHQLHLIAAFAAGVLIAAALLDLLPDAFHQVEQTGESSIENVLLGAALCFLAFYALDRFVHSSAAMHTPRPGKAAFGTVASLGLTIHSFLDGFAIGSGFRVNATIGCWSPQRSLPTISATASQRSASCSARAAAFASRSAGWWRMRSLPFSAPVSR